MTSSLYAVKRLDDIENVQVAVLVVESMSAQGFDEAELRGTLDGIADDYAQLIRTLKRYIPNPANAAESGL